MNFRGSPPKKKVDKPDSKKDRFWQIQAFFHWNILKAKNKGRKRRIREGGLQSGRRCCGVKQIAWKHTSTCMDTHETGYRKPRHITRLVYEQREGVCVWRQDEAVGVAWRDAIPPLWQVGTPWYHLFVILNWQRAQEARVLHKPYPVWLCAGELILPKPSLLFSHDAEGSAEHPQLNLQQGWVGGGGAVFTCVLRQGTELTAHTGL